MIQRSEFSSVRWEEAMNFDLESNFDVFLARDMLNTKSFWK